MTTIRLRHLVKIGPRPMPDQRLAADAEVTFAPMDALADGLGGLDSSLTRPVSEVTAGSYNYFADGDLLLAKVTPCFENGKKALARGLANGVGFATSEVHVIRPDACRIHPRYLLYVLSSKDFRAAGMASMTGAGGLRRVSEAAVLDYRPRITDLPTQQAIADFLDRETARIDQLIDKKQRFADLLVAREKASTLEIISGRRQNAPGRKPSRLSWVGAIPFHWNEQPLKQVASVIDCKHTTPEYVEDGIPLISTGEVKPYSISFTSQRLVSESDYLVMTDGGRAPRPSDIIYSRNASVGAAAMVGSLGRFCMGQDICLVRPVAVETSFLEHQLNSEIVLQQLGVLLVGSTLKRVNINDIKSFFLLLPPEQEQVKIARQVNEALTKSRDHRRLLGKSINRLREFRAALITVAVTGQIDVATWGKRGDSDRRLDRIEEETAVAGARA